MSKVGKWESFMDKYFSSSYSTAKGLASLRTLYATLLTKT